MVDWSYCLITVNSRFPKPSIGMGILCLSPDTPPTGVMCHAQHASIAVLVRSISLFQQGRTSSIRRTSGTTFRFSGHTCPTADIDYLPATEVTPEKWLPGIVSIPEVPTVDH